MSGYLQRLFDRAAAMDAPMPSSPSLSPVAQADQRLMVPGLGDALMFQAVPANTDEPADERALDASQLPQHTAERYQSPSRPAAPAPADQRIGDSGFERTRQAQQDPLRSPPLDLGAPTPDADVPATLAIPVHRQGAISDDDFERLHPDSPLPGVQPDEPHPAPTLPPPARDGAFHDSTAQLPEAAQPALIPDTRSSTAPVEPSAKNTQNWVENQQGSSVAEPSPASATRKWTSSGDDPTAMAQPVAPPTPFPQMADAEPPQPESVRTDSVREIVREIVKSDNPATIQPSAPARAMTATEVSVIGALPESRRAYTLFGVRRR